MSAGKIVYQLDAESYFVGETIARESPLEPGVWHLPAGAVATAPPQLADGERARWSPSGGWELVPPAPAPVPSPPSAAELLAHARVRRLEAEASGVTVGGLTFASDIESQARISATLAYLAAAGLDTVEWKAWQGFVVLSAGQLAEVGLAVGTHVQSCFATEALLTTEIAHGDVTTYVQIDAAAWPGKDGAA